MIILSDRFFDGACDGATMADDGSCDSSEDGDRTMMPDDDGSRDSPAGAACDDACDDGGPFL